MSGLLRRRGVLGEAVFSPCERYRYALTRELDGDGGDVLFVMLNPSTADQDANDPSVRRCVGFARRLGARRLVVCNAFGLRSTDPCGLRRVEDPAGPNNQRVILSRAARCDRLVVAWGNHAGEHGRRLARTLAKKRTLWCLGVTGQGQPRHPLYIRGDAPLVRYEAAQASHSP